MTVLSVVLQCRETIFSPVTEAIVEVKTSFLRFYKPN